MKAIRKMVYRIESIHSALATLSRLMIYMAAATDARMHMICADVESKTAQIVGITEKEDADKT